MLHSHFLPILFLTKLPHRTLCLEMTMLPTIIAFTVPVIHIVAVPAMTTSPLFCPCRSLEFTSAVNGQIAFDQVLFLDQPC